jgi:hypothetical protein
MPNYGNIGRMMDGGGGAGGIFAPRVEEDKPRTAPSAGRTDVGTGGSARNVLNDLIPRTNFPLPGNAFPGAIVEPGRTPTPGTTRPDINVLRPVGDIAIAPGIIDRFPGLLPGGLRPLPLPQPEAPNRTATQLADASIKQLESASADLLQRAIRIIESNRQKNITPATVMNYLERRVRIGEVVNQLARAWSADTQRDFAEAFNMPATELDAMDTIVSLGILNDPDLVEQLRGENIAIPTETDLLQNRRIVWQYPPAGAPLDPPYVVIVAVEHLDVAHGEDVVQQVLGALVDYNGYKIPSGAAKKLA